MNPRNASSSHTAGNKAISTSGSHQNGRLLEQPLDLLEAFADRADRIEMLKDPLEGEVKRMHGNRQPNAARIACRRRSPRISSVLRGRRVSRNVIAKTGIRIVPT